MTAGAGVRAIGAAAADAMLDRAVADAAQLELLPSRFEPGSKRHREVVAASERRKAGRPQGATNLANRQVVEFVRRVFGDPMIERSRWLLHSAEGLAAELGCTKFEAAQFQDRIWADLQRFMYAPLAAVDGAGNAVAPVFQMVAGRDVNVSGAVPPWVYDGGPELPQVIETAPNSAPDNSASHGPASHEADK